MSRVGRGYPRAGVGAIALACLAAAGRPAPRPSTAPPAPAVHPAAAEFPTYRVVGRAKFMFITFSANDVGGARLTWERSGDAESVRLLVGSEPARAPRDLNEWAYTSEEIVGDRASVFALRSPSAPEFGGASD